MLKGQYLAIPTHFYISQSLTSVVLYLKFFVCTSEKLNGNLLQTYNCKEVRSTCINFLVRGGITKIYENLHRE